MTTKSRAAVLLEKMTKAQRLVALTTLGTEIVRNIIVDRRRKGWQTTDVIYINDRNNKPELVSMTKGTGVLIIHPNGFVDTYVDKKDVPFKEA